MLGQYLSNHALEQQDFHALTAFFLEHETVRSEYLRTLLAEWLNRFPDDPLAWATSAQLADYRTPWESEISFLGGHRGAILKQAPSHPDLLRRYAKYLLQHYWSLRSAFHLPDAEEVEFVLEQLIRLDPPFQRVCRMHLAELAWNRGDEERFLELAGQAFDPDAQWGPVNYDLDELATHRTLALWIETYWRRGNITEAWKFSQLERRAQRDDRKAQKNNLSNFSSCRPRFI